MPTQIPLKFYKVNGTIQALPDYQINGRYPEATPSEVQAEIARWSNKSDQWSQEYARGLQQNLQKVQAGQSDYALDEKTGNLTTNKAIVEQANNEAAVKAGTMKNVGTAAKPVYVPVGSAADVLIKKNPSAAQLASSGNSGGGVGSATDNRNGGGGGGNNSGSTPAPVKAEYKNSSEYKALTPDLQQLVDLGFSTFQDTPEKQQIFTDAITRAAALADPYAKTQLALFKGTYDLQIAKSTNDYKAQKEVLDRTRKDLADTLKLNGDNLSLEQQTEIAKQVKQHDIDMLDIADQAAEKGITFATGERSRALAEERNTTQFNDVIQSTNRQYNFNRSQLELRAKQGDTDAQAQLDKATADKGFQLQSIGQAAEKVIGSGGAGNLGIEGFKPTGGNLGDVEQQRREAIIKGASAALPQ